MRWSSARASTSGSRSCRSDPPWPPDTGGWRPGEEQAKGRGCQPRPLALVCLWLLVQVDLVAVEILEKHPGPPWFALRLAVEGHAPLLHAAVLAETVVGAQGEQRKTACLLADYGQVALRPSQGQRQSRL